MGDRTVFLTMTRWRESIRSYELGPDDGSQILVYSPLVVSAVQRTKGGGWTKRRKTVKIYTAEIATDTVVVGHQDESAAVRGE